MRSTNQTILADVIVTLENVCFFSYQGCAEGRSVLVNLSRARITLSIYIINVRSVVYSRINGFVYTVFCFYTSNSSFLPFSG